MFKTDPVGLAGRLALLAMLVAHGEDLCLVRPGQAIEGIELFRCRVRGQWPRIGCPRLSGGPLRMVVWGGVAIWCGRNGDEAEEQQEKHLKSCACPRVQRWTGHFAESVPCKVQGLLPKGVAVSLQRTCLEARDGVVADGWEHQKED